MEASLKSVDSTSTPHSVKRWQLHGTDYEPRRSPSQQGTADTRFSAWTPLVNKPSNQQCYRPVKELTPKEPVVKKLFEERVNLLLHWFDLWTDRQRKHLMHTLLTRCTKSQLRYCRDRLMETVPVTHVDFTTLLPRFLSLHVMSFLTPRELCSAAQVSWHWRVLAEQDCLWAGRCVRRGWFLPYSPGDKERGAWKTHYVSCVSTLDWLTPREAAEQYGTLNQPSVSASEEEEERRKERVIRQCIRERLQEEKRLSLRTRRAWGSNSQLGATRSGCTQRQASGSGETFSFKPSLSWPPGDTLFSSSLHLNQEQTSPALALQNARASSSFSERGRMDVSPLVSFTHRLSPPGGTRHPTPRSHCTLVLLLSNRIPAYELVLSGVKVEVLVILYDYRGTLPALLGQVKRALDGQRIRRLGLLAPGGTEEVRLLQRCSLSETTALNPDFREFWENLCGWIMPSEEGGGVDIFSPLSASASGVALIQILSTLSGLEVCSPMALATGSFQNILSEWSNGSVCGGTLSRRVDEEEAPPSAVRYVCENVLQGWCRQAHWMEEALGDMRCFLGSRLHRLSLEARGRALGHFLWDHMCLEELCLSKELTETLVEGLTVITTQGEMRPLEFLSVFLKRQSEEKEGQVTDAREKKGPDEEKGLGFLMESRTSCRHLCPIPEVPQAALDWRGAVARELYYSESLYLGRLGAVVKVYHQPLTAALNSNRAILSSAHIHMVLSPLMHIQELNRQFQVELEARLQCWGAEQCIGDVCMKLCSKLRVYTNYLNNYPTALHTIDQCREMSPSFRAFLKRADRTLATHMLSLQELLLCPVWRVKEYVTLLQALSLHTHPGHPDHMHLSSALNTLRRYGEFIHKLKRNSKRDTLMEETQKMIQCCPNLCEGNRQLIVTQDAALLRSTDEDIPDSLRTYEQVSDVGLFLFNDALVLTRRSVGHVPFALSRHHTHAFLASVALASLAFREIIHTRYVCHAFVLQGPSRSWVCATETGEEREMFLSALRLAIDNAVTC